VDFKIYYVICLDNDSCSISRLQLDGQQQGIINVSDFGKKYNSITLVISTGEKTSGFGRSEMAYPFSFEATAMEKENGSEEIIQEFLTQINYFGSETGKYEEEISKLQKKGEVEGKIVRELLNQISRLKSEINECGEEINKFQKEGEIESGIAQELLAQIDNLKSRTDGCKEEINKLQIIQEKPKEEPKEREKEISLVDLFLGAINDSRMARFQGFLKNQRAIIYIAFRCLFL
jgi:archaellum component FlaC